MIKNEAIEYYINNIKSGVRSEDAFHSLLEIGEPAVKRIMAEIETECAFDYIEVFIDLLGQIRCKQSLPLLGHLLLRNESAVWKSSLRAIVLIGGEDALVLLKSIINGLPNDSQLKRDWLREALSQIKHV